jgi:cytochrome b561
MQIKNTENHFGLVAIILHWVMAIILIGLVALGFYMVWIPISLDKLKLFGWHKEYGIVALVLVMIRIGWRLANRNPSLASLPRLEIFAARTVHYTFYLFMRALPISGWLITSAAGLPVSVFDWFVLPNLVSPNEEQRLVFQQIHTWLGYGLIATFCCHVGAALKHHFINKDDILKRML